MNAIEWCESIDNVDWVEVSELYKAAPLGDKSPERLQRAFSNSMFYCFAYDAQILVGVGRALADGVDCSYICDVAVLPSHQGTGLGQQIVARLVTLSEGHKKIILYSVPGKEAFYRRFGFEKMATAMAIFDDAESARQRGYLMDPKADQS